MPYPAPVRLTGKRPDGSIALVGQPNVGKSALFHQLTGQRTVVSNYPGTTVEMMRGMTRLQPGQPLVDTPGVITFPCQSEDEQVTERVLLDEPLSAILQVGDAKNLRRTLLMALQLSEMGLPMLLALNMSDEADARGLQVDVAGLASRLGIPVVATVATRGKGVAELSEALPAARPAGLQVTYPQTVESALLRLISRLAPLIGGQTLVEPRALALLWLCQDAVITRWLELRLPAEDYADLQRLRETAQNDCPAPLGMLIQNSRMQLVEELASEVLQQSSKPGLNLAYRLGYLTLHPVWGIFILIGVLLALYVFVGLFGAGYLVGLLEKGLFGQLINPAVTGLIERLVASPLVVQFLVGPYGLWTMGITYALALILPIVTTFFFAFSLLEDSGYLPRLAALTNRLFVALGLNGKAVLPMVLGLGCVTMATVTTRVLESKRDRLLVTLLLALAVPCSAQLGVVMGILAGVSFGAFLIWGGVVLAVLLVVGWLAAHLVPGNRSQLLVELPPLRVPQLANVISKTLARLEWYLKEVVPLFLIGAALMFFLDITGLLDRLIHFTQPLVTGWLGMPPEASAAFLMGFLRRDFGATGLFVMASHGQLTPVQVVVAMVTVTLFIPCIASLMMIARERGWRTAAGMMVVIMPLAFLIGGLLNRFLLLVGWGG